MAEVILDPQERPRGGSREGVARVAAATTLPGFIAGAVRALGGGGGASNIPFSVGVDLETGKVRTIGPPAVQKVIDAGKVPRVARGAVLPEYTYAKQQEANLQAIFDGQDVALRKNYERYRNDLVVLGEQYRSGLAPRARDVPSPDINPPGHDEIPPELPPDVFGPGDIPFPRADPFEGGAGGIFIPIDLRSLTMPNPYMPFSGLAPPRSARVATRRRRASAVRASAPRRKKRSGKKARLVKGSAAAKRYMAKLRRMRK